MSDEKPEKPEKEEKRFGWCSGSEWTEEENAILERLRREKRPRMALDALKPRPKKPPRWAEEAVAERAEERQVLAAYAASSPEVRQWIDGIVNQRLIGRKHPDRWRDVTLRDVLVDWRNGKLNSSDDENQNQEVA